MAAGFKELQWLPVAVSAHFQRRVRVRFGDEMTGVSLRLFNLRRVASVTPIATGVQLTMRAGLINRNDLTGLVLLPAVTGDAIVLGVCRDSSVAAQKPSTRQA